MKSLEALEDIITIYSNIVSTNRCVGKKRFVMCVRQIKQDLEVLEILKALIIHNIKSVGFKSAIVDYKVLVHTGELKQEQLEELEQWLEEQDD